MPIVEHFDFPTFQRLRDEGQDVLTLDTATSQDIRELHIGLLNMMPDAALQVTERQFIRLIGSSNQIVQFYLHPFTVPGIPRSSETQEYIETYYRSLDDIYAEGLDALIITGANVQNPRLEQEPFWKMLTEVMEWAAENVTSMLCSCLATHALMKYFYRIDRIALPRKQWGVYSHRIATDIHPLLRNINTRFDVPHSRYNAISREQFEQAGLTVLIDSNEAGVHLAVSEDQFRYVYFQGHPEYDINSLLKEYKREVFRYLNDERDCPPHPDNYFNQVAAMIADEFIAAAEDAKAQGNPLPPFPEAAIQPHLDNTWGDTGKSVVNNWLGLVYQLTNVDRKRPFMDGIDPANPLGLL